MRHVLILLCGVLACIGCAATPSSFSFAVVGDAPYVPDDEARFASMLDELNRADVAFVVHVGDIQADAGMPSPGGIPTCTDLSLARRKELFDASAHPFVLTPGDNDWVDCHRAPDRAVDPLERLAKLRDVLFANRTSLGQTPMRMSAQSDEPGFEPFVENRTWTRDGVVFVTAHIVSPTDTSGRTAALDAEYAERNAASLLWIEQAFARAKRGDAKAIVVIAHANPMFEATWPASTSERYSFGLDVGATNERARVFDDLLALLERETIAFARSVLFVHGDTHLFRIDKPLVRRADGRPILSFTRLESFGYPELGWIRVTVDPIDAEPFTFHAIAK